MRGHRREVVKGVLWGNLTQAKRVLEWESTDKPKGHRPSGGGAEEVTAADDVKEHTITERTQIHKKKKSTQSRKGRGRDTAACGGQGRRSVINKEISLKPKSRPPRGRQKYAW